MALILSGNQRLTRQIISSTDGNSLQQTAPILQQEWIDSLGILPSTWIDVPANDVITIDPTFGVTQG